MFEKYTERAKKILFLARYEASQKGSKVIASEHLLLGLLKEGDEITREIFRRSNVNVELLQAEMETRERAAQVFAERKWPSVTESLCAPYAGTKHIVTPSHLLFGRTPSHCCRSSIRYSHQVVPLQLRLA